MKLILLLSTVIGIGVLLGGCALDEVSPPTAGGSISAPGAADLSRPPTATSAGGSIQ